MCGIAGIIDLTEQRAVPEALLRKMAQAIVHRGPDEEGFYFRPGIGLASRRLSIVGLAEVITKLPQIFKVYRMVKRYLTEERPDAVILIDYPGFNLKLIAPLAHQLGSYGEVARDLAYRLYLICERKKWSQEGVNAGRKGEHWRP